jgi:hypothetical protein
MADRPLPIFRSQDYSFFQSTVAELPKGYINWFDKHRREMRRLVRLGERPVEVMVDPGAFDEFCHAHKCARNLKALEAFVIEKAAAVQTEARFRAEP